MVMSQARLVWFIYTPWLASERERIPTYGGIWSLGKASAERERLPGSAVARRVCWNKLSRRKRRINYSGHFTLVVPLPQGPGGRQVGCGGAQTELRWAEGVRWVVVGPRRSWGG